MEKRSAMQNSKKVSQYKNTSTPIMLAENVIVEIKDGHVLLDFDATERLGLTSTGKSFNVVGEMGWGITIPGTNLSVSLHVRVPSRDK